MSAIDKTAQGTAVLEASGNAGAEAARRRRRLLMERRAQAVRAFACKGPTGGPQRDASAVGWAAKTPHENRGDAVHSKPPTAP